MGRVLRLVATVAALIPARFLLAQCPDGTPPPCGAPRLPRLAVLYFENRSPDSADAYLAQGLSEELIRQLSRRGDVVVTSRFSVRRFGTGANFDPAALARALGVDYVLTGSVQRSGTRLRLNAELVRVPSGRLVWSDHMDRRLSDILDVQDDLAATVTRQVGNLRRTQPASQTNPRVGFAAMERFMRGNFQIDQRNVREAIREHAEATRLAPDFGRAWARLAYAYALLLDRYNSPDTLALGLAAADRAMALAPEESDSWMARAYLRMLEERRTLGGAVEAFERAVQLDSTNAEALLQMGWALTLLGRNEESERAYSRAIDLDPSRMQSFVEIGRLYHMKREYRRAVRALDSAQALRGQANIEIAMLRFWSLSAMGDTARARADIGFATASDPSIRSMRAMHLAANGDTAAARTELANLLQQVERGAPFGPGSLMLAGKALMAAGLREETIRMTLLVRSRERLFAYNLSWPEYDPIRSDPRIQQIIAEFTVP